MPHFTFPDISHKEKYLAMIEEWREFETIPTSPGRLFAGESYEEFLDIIITDVTASPYGANSTLFYFMDDENILASIQIRHHIDSPGLSPDGRAGGHIGYGFRPSTRGKGLAKEMLSLGLLEARKLGIEKVLISADEDNPSSWKTIESCGGVFAKMIEKDGKPLKIYWIDNRGTQNMK